MSQIKIKRHCNYQWTFFSKVLSHLEQFHSFPTPLFFLIKDFFIRTVFWKKFHISRVGWQNLKCVFFGYSKGRNYFLPWHRYEVCFKTWKILLDSWKLVLKFIVRYCWLWLKIASLNYGTERWRTSCSNENGCKFN